MLGGRERNVREATRVVRAPGVRHYWDGHGWLQRALRETLALDQPVWDVYLVFDREALWEEGRPPDPVFWMHQLGRGVDAPALDAPAFAARVLTQAAS